MEYKNMQKIKNMTSKSRAFVSLAVTRDFSQINGHLNLTEKVAEQKNFVNLKSVSNASKWNMILMGGQDLCLTRRLKCNVRYS